MASWLEAAVADVLQKVLGAFVRGIDKDSLKLSIWSGDVRLKGLELRTEVLDALPIPVHVLGASLGEIRVVVPWRNLFGKEPLSITVEKLLVLVKPRGDDDAAAADPADQASEEEREAKAAAEAKARSDLADAKDSVDTQATAGKQMGPNMVERLVQLLLRKLQACGVTPEGWTADFHRPGPVAELGGWRSLWWLGREARRAARASEPSPADA